MDSEFFATEPIKRNNKIKSNGQVAYHLWHHADLIADYSTSKFIGKISNSKALTLSIIGYPSRFRISIQ